MNIIASKTLSLVVVPAMASLAAFAALAADDATAPNPPHPFGRQSALADVKKLDVAAGLEARLFACEPDVVNPADMDVDARGRVWICEGANYRSSFQKWGVLRAGGDRIVILEDTNRDGMADKNTVF